MNQVTAFAQLLRIRGENVTFRGVTVRALIDRTPKAGNPPGNIEVTTQRGSVVQLPLTVSAPEQGDVITDGHSIKHRVLYARHIGHCWNCECEGT